MFDSKKKIKRPYDTVMTYLDGGPLQEHFDSMKNHSIDAYIFNKVLNGDKTLILLVAGSLTGLSINILTGFLGFSKLNICEFILHGLRLIFALIFNVIFLLFAAKYTKIKESGLQFTFEGKTTLSDIRKQQYNIVYDECMKQIVYLKCTYWLSILFALLTLLSLVFGNIFIKELRIWKTCLLNK